MSQNTHKHSEKVTINLTHEEYQQVLVISGEADLAVSTVARKLLLRGIRSFDNPTKIALENMEG